MSARVLVAGIGNIFKGDDAFGVEVAKALSARGQNESVEIADFGIRGIDLAYTLCDSKHELVVLVDLVQRGGAPGTIYVIEPDLEKLAAMPPRDGGHGMDPAQVLSWVAATGTRLGTIRLVGCEPAEVVGEEALVMGLSPAVADAVENAVDTVQTLIREVFEGEGYPRCTSWG